MADLALSFKTQGRSGATALLASRARKSNAPNGNFHACVPSFSCGVVFGDTIRLHFALPSPTLETVYCCLLVGETHRRSHTLRPTHLNNPVTQPNPLVH